MEFDFIFLLPVTILRLLILRAFFVSFYFFWLVFSFVI
jgi:hypothetical protein